MKSDARRALERALTTRPGWHGDRHEQPFGEELVQVRADDLRDYLAETLDPDDAPPRPVGPCPKCKLVGKHRPGCVLGVAPVDTGQLRRSITAE